jgi:DNA helicase-2/ATP-dependent DNA helicase PcrA
MSIEPRPAPGAITSQFGRSTPSYLNGLNPEQEDAVLTTEGPLLVLAGAGTGKTRVLTTRIAYILNRRLALGNQILAVTFTNKAAKEMKYRIEDFEPNLGAMPWMGTFHSMGARIVRRHAELVGLEREFTILDADDQIRLIKQLFEAANIDQKRWTPKWFAAILDNWKNRGWQPAEVPDSEESYFANGKAREIYAAYQARLKTLNAADFGDLLLECIRLFRENPEILAEYHRRFRYILVDEYQDTNAAQYIWLQLLAHGTTGPALDNDGNPLKAAATNICVVGDDDQSIYGWRGAEVDNILRFERDFPGAKVIRLERNYRSTSNILTAASHLIAHNESRLGKTLQTDVGEDGEKLTVSSVWDSEEEARQVGEEIEQIQRRGDALNSIAILVRTSAQMRAFEDRFNTIGLNYRVIGGPRFYERREIRDAIAYFRIVNQPADDLAFERIINVPKRGIGDTTVKTLMEAARLQNVPLFEATRQLTDTEELKPKQRSTLNSLVHQFEDWTFKLQTTPHHELAEMILDESGYTAMWQNDKGADARGRLENLKELIRFMEDFESLGGFLEHIALVMDRDTGESEDAVSIMTLHSAKGLEFDSVFLPGWEDGLFPNQRVLDESGKTGLEEERRLAYVGITRARRRAMISLAQNRRTHGLWQTAIPSRFLDELPADVVEVKDSGSSYGGYNYGGRNTGSRFDQFTRDPFESVYESPGWKRAQRQQSQRRSPGPMTIEGELVARSVDNGRGSAYKVGDRVRHLKFGLGTVAGIEGNKLSIDFDSVGRKRVIESFIQRG